MKKEIMQALNELNIAFYDFKSANDKKIADLEQNTAGSLVNEKLKNLDTDILNLEKKLKKMELKRPDFETENSCGNSENDREFKSYLLSGVKKSLNECKSSVMLENNNAYQAPGYIVDNINASLDAQSVIRRYARRIKTSASAAELILHTKNPDAGWVDNGRNSGEYDANIEFRKVKIPVHEIYARPRTTKSMIEDSVQNVEEWIVNATVDQIANVENHAFWFGNGENQPTGIFYYPRSESGVFDNETKTFQEFRGDTDGISGEGISVDMLVDVVLSLKPKYLSKARWIMPRSVLAVIRKMKDKDGRYIWSVGRMSGGEAHNIIADVCEMKISFRFYDMNFAERVGKRVQEICEEIVANYGGRVEINWNMSTGPVINNKEVVDRIISAASKAEIPVEAIESRMSSEDFGWYLTKAPGALFRFGTRNEKKGCTTVAHNNDFLMDEDGMKYAIKTFCVCILNSGN